MGVAAIMVLGRLKALLAQQSRQSRGAGAVHAQHQQHPPQRRWGIGVRRGRHPHQLQRLPLGSGHRSGTSPNSLGLHKRQGGLLLLSKIPAA